MREINDQQFEFLTAVTAGMLLLNPHGVSQKAAETMSEEDWVDLLRMMGLLQEGT